MHIVRFADSDATVHCGLLVDGVIRVLEQDRIADLLALSLAELRVLAEEPAATPVAAADVTLLPPLDGRMEVWAAGVTYHRSREARMEESAERSVYEKVYDAPRPELFFKAVPWRVVTDGDAVRVRPDSSLTVPEPELGLVVNAHAEIVGYLVVDDVSSRSIEGENPLYLPQAKVYEGSCAVSAGIRPVWEVPDVKALEIAMTITRGDEIAFKAAISTASLHRPVSELVSCLFDGQPYPEGAVLATGTGIVPGMDFTLTPGDVVDIDIAGVGRLVTPVR
ncbi:fumarylacetoacetate hydrolase family protein [Amycolatopsis acididurans]|nr:fumarylacetoacetate hydrolase family protein [Amycolatopsis acididurans]